MNDITEKIAKLLSLAEAAGTPEEAEAAFAKAQQLASKFAIDLEVARRAAAPQKREEPTMRTIRIGEKGKRANKPLILLYSRIAESNDITVLIANDSTLVYATGMPSDLDYAESLWVALSTTMVRLGDALVRDKNAAWRNETDQVWNASEWRFEEKKVSAQGARRSFYDGFISRIGQRLRDARLEAIKEKDDHFHNDGATVAAAAAEGAVHGMALVLQEKRAEVEAHQWAWYERKYGKRRPRGSWRGSATGTRSGSAHSAGDAAGRNAALSGRRAVGAGAPPPGGGAARRATTNGSPRSM